MVRGKKGYPRGWLLAAAVLMATWVCPFAATAEDDGLEGLLEDVGRNYAEAYLVPLISAFGVNQNSALYHTAYIPNSRVTVSFGLKVMGSRIAEDDQTFRAVQSVTLDESYGLNPGDDGYGEPGTLVMSGPTVFGNTEGAGDITAYWNGIPVYSESGIEGLWETRMVPLFMPQVSVGGISGFQATLRWMPDISLGDIGKVKLFGFGLQYGVSQLFANPPLGLDIMVGLFKQSLDVGDILSASASSYFGAASKTFGLATVYGGVTLESSSMDVEYTQVNGGGNDTVKFEMDGLQERRLTLGGTLKLGALLNVEMNFGRLTTFAGGLMFGF